MKLLRDFSHLLNFQASSVLSSYGLIGAFREGSTAGFDETFLNVVTLIRHFGLVLTIVVFGSNLTKEAESTSVLFTKILSGTEPTALNQQDMIFLNVVVLQTQTRKTTVRNDLFAIDWSFFMAVRHGNLKKKEI